MNEGDLKLPVNSDQDSSPVLTPNLEQDEADGSQKIELLIQFLKTSRYSGPVPPPDMLREFDKIDPGRAAKLLQLAEDQSRHRMKLEARVIENDIWRSWTGLILGFLISLATVAGGVYVAKLGHPTSGATIATAAVVALAGVFVYGTNSQRKERKERTQALAKTSGD